MKTSELTGLALDWAVGKALNWSQAFINLNYPDGFHPSTNWAQGGAIIERECIDLQYQGGETDVWASDIFDADSMVYGDTPLIASMRCYVTSKLGDEVEIPNDINV